jgi:polyhydroxyalkanoate synthesis regulator phasin
MTHLTEDELVDAYYDDLPAARRDHLGECTECRTSLVRLTELLDEIRTAPAPARGPGYGREVWARLEPRLNARKPHWWARRWVLGPAGVALLAASFVGGMLTMRTHPAAVIQQPALPKQAGVSDKDSQRVFLAAMSDHLDRSEILLAQLLHAAPGELDTNDERARARDLVEENRLLRETAWRSGDRAHAALLDDLGRVFLDLANSPRQLSTEDVDELRRRVEDQGLLFKVRVTSTDARSKGQTL